MSLDANDINRFKELTFTLGKKEVQILQAAARGPNRVNALTMCKLYVPSLAPEQANKFIDWLSRKTD